MTRWRNGEAEIDALLAAGHLQRITGAQADGAPWLERSRRMLKTARDVADDDPESGFVLTYDAARHACTGLLAHQGLRPTTSVRHYAVEQAVRAQFGDAFKPFATLRRRRHEVEYPAFPGELVEVEEVIEALDVVERLVDGAERLLARLGVY